MSKNDQLSEAEIDALVVAQADDASAWEEAIEVELPIPTTMQLPPELAARAAFFAQLHQQESAETWLKRIIQERLDFEENAFAGLKRVLVAKLAETV